MAFNVPAYTESRFSFGPGILYLGTVGTTPLVDVGAVKGDAELLIQRTSLELKQGSPQSLVRKYALPISNRPASRICRAVFRPREGLYDYPRAQDLLGQAKSKGRHRNNR